MTESSARRMRNPAKVLNLYRCRSINQITSIRYDINDCRINMVELYKYADLKNSYLEANSCHNIFSGFRALIV